MGAVIAIGCSALDLMARSTEVVARGVHSGANAAATSVMAHVPATLRHRIPAETSKDNII